MRIKETGEESMPPKGSRKTSKRTVAEPNKGDRGDNKCGGSVLERKTGGAFCCTAETLENRIFKGLATQGTKA